MKAKKLALSLLAGTLACSALAINTPAHADPVGGAFRTLVGTGSDTTQSVMDALAEVVTDSSGNQIIGSYDAIDPTTGVAGGTIQTRANGATFTRPNGSGAGIQALTSSVKGLTYPAANGVDVTDQLDFARSSSGPSGSGTDLTYIPFAKDAVSYAYSNTDAAAAVPSDLTTAQLKGIFSGDITTYVGSDSATHTYVPILPQSGSGSRKFFLSSLGLTESNVAWITTTFQENEGTTIDAVGEIAPFSAAAYIAQTNAKITNTISTNKVVLGSVDSVSPFLSGGALNASFPLARNVYNVVATSRLSGTTDSDLLLQSTFVGSSSKICLATSTITDYGFGTIDNCGATTTTGPFVVNGSAPTLVASPAPAISGAARIGQVLTASTGTWSGASSLSYAYQWLRSGSPINGATGSSYLVSTSDAGKVITVRVTASARAASTSAVSTGVAVPKLAAKASVKFDKSASNHKKKGKVTVKISVTGVSAPTGTITVLDGKKKLAKVTLTVSKKGVAVAKLPKLSKKKHSISVVYSGTSSIAGKTVKISLKVK
jgi:hypothetical protein